MFKYMSTKVAPLFAKTLKVRFTQPFGLDDPFELRPFMDFEGTAAEARKVVEPRLAGMYGTVDAALATMEKYQAKDPNFPLRVPIHQLRKMTADNQVLGQQIMAAIQEHKTEVLDNKRMAVHWEARWEKFRQALGEPLGILCLTEDPAHPVMWSHNASEHYSVVVEFDENHPWFSQRRTPSDDIRHLVRVSYIQNPHPLTWKQVSATDMLYTKGAEWAYQREWRIIRPLKDGTEAGGGIVCFDVPPGAILSIIFGSRTTSTLEQEIRASVASNPALSHISFKRARLVAGGKIEIVDADR
jgi:hypothetical protein